MQRQTVDFIVVGGGIVGLATAWRLTQAMPDARLALLEKESAVAQHQSGRNSGVLHSGIYYKPGSLKAITCRAGKLQLEQFCDEQALRYERCGKVIVAVDEEELPRLSGIFERGVANGIQCRIIDRRELRDLEPAVAGEQAIHVTESGIVDYPAVCRRLAELLIERGHAVHLGQTVRRIVPSESSVQVETDTQRYHAGMLVTCGGLYSDRLVHMSGLKAPAQIIPFRGEYYELVPDQRSLCRNLIYPVPDPNFPFLGVHFTRMINGDVECGPNAVFALAREGYNWGNVRWQELGESLLHGGFRRLAIKHWRMGLGEIHRSLSKPAFVRALQRLIPSIRGEHLRPCRAGVRAQAITPDGNLVDDFLWVVEGRMVHVCNAPSPAATASLEIGRQIAARVQQQLATSGGSGQLEGA
jgi:(S)-2-hydroxyglutarate dehydrogenase